MSIEALCIQWDNVGFALSRKPFLYKTCHFDSLTCLLQLYFDYFC